MNNEKYIHKVLVVDDSPLFAQALKKLVSFRFTSVETALSGEDAIKKMVSFKPEIMLLDITMPNMDGRECLEKVLKINKQLMVIMISGIQKEDVRKQCLNAGAKLFINKEQIRLNDSLNNVLLNSLDDLVKELNFPQTGTQ